MPWSIVGHEWAVTLLRQSLATGRVAHAYLFSGPSQVGKTTLALALAQALNCRQPDAPCGQCRSCRRISQNTHPDVRLVLGEGAGGTIKIEQIRALQREAVLAPYEGRYRVYVLRRIDWASMEAANSLLKILEEPPAKVVLGLTAVQTQALPPTIVSRCQRLDLRPASYQVVEAALRARGLPQPEAQLLARLSGGRVGWAFRAIEEDAMLKQRLQELDQLVALLRMDRAGRLEYVSKTGYRVEALRPQVGRWISWWRDLLVLCSQSNSPVANVDRLDELRSVAAQATLQQALEGLKALQATAEQLEANVNPRLALEGLLLKFPRWQQAQ